MKPVTVTWADNNGELETNTFPAHSRQDAVDTVTEYHYRADGAQAFEKVVAVVFAETGTIIGPEMGDTPLDFLDEKTGFLIDDGEELE